MRIPAILLLGKVVRLESDFEFVRWLYWLSSLGMLRTLYILVFGFVDGLTCLESVSSTFLFSVRNANKVSWDCKDRKVRLG